MVFALEYTVDGNLMRSGSSDTLPEAKSLAVLARRRVENEIKIFESSGSVSFGEGTLVAVLVGDEWIEVTDDDPEFIAGMLRLRALREAAGGVPDIH